MSQPNFTQLLSSCLCPYSFILLIAQMQLASNWINAPSATSPTQPSHYPLQLIPCPLQHGFYPLHPASQFCHQFSAHYLPLQNAPCSMQLFPTSAADFLPPVLHRPTQSSCKPFSQLGESVEVSAYLLLHEGSAWQWYHGRCPLWLTVPGTAPGLWGSIPPGWEPDSARPHSSAPCVKVCRLRKQFCAFAEYTSRAVKLGYLCLVVYWPMIAPP